jgi:hypothetical protein
MWRILLFWIVGAASAAAMPDPPPPYFEDAAQDTEGMIWAYSRAEYNHIYRFDGTAWSEIPAPFPAKVNAMPAYVVRMKDGAVACVWVCGEQQIAVTRHLGQNSTLLGIGPGKVSYSGLSVEPLADSQNRLWVTGESSFISRTDGKDKVELVHQIQPDEWRDARLTRQGYNRIHAIEDGHGRVWVWSDPAADNYASLRGVLLFTGDKCERRDILPAQTKGPGVLAIALADATHLWVSVADDGVYKLDIDTFALERTPDPVPKAVCCVHELHMVGDDLYAVEDLPDDRNSLWRYRDGKWENVLPQLDFHAFSRNARVWLPVKEGLLVTTNGGGPWFLPDDGKPAQFTWQTGFTLEDFHGLAQLADGTFFGLGLSGEIFHGPLDLPPKAKAQLRFTEFDEDRGSVGAANGHFWTVDLAKPPKLRDWDGTAWSDHPLPEDVQPSDNRLLEDQLGRIWSISDVPAFFEPHPGDWHVFPSMRDAMLFTLKQPVTFTDDVWFHAPVYSANHRRLAYRDMGSWAVEYYDGSAWHRYKREDLPAKSGDDFTLGPPWFDDKGRLHVNVRDHVSLVRDDSGTWSKIPWVSHYPDDVWSENGNAIKRPPLPEGIPITSPDAMVADNAGACWMISQGTLYRAIAGVCVPIFQPGEDNPFRSIHDLRAAFVDAHGNVFLQVAAYTLHWIMIRPHGPSPATQVTLEQKTADSYIAHFDAHTTAPVKFRWQLDDGEKGISDTPTVLLYHLPNGPHVLQVVGMDDELNMDPKPVEVKFTVNVDAVQQVAQLVAQLSDPDYDQRKAAVQALAQQPVIALPALQKALDAASDDQKWWITAAIQECQRRQNEQKK